MPAVRVGEPWTVVGHRYSSCYRTGHCCTLRATAAGRNARAVMTAYAWAREAERADPLAVVTSTVMSGNVRARRLLTSRRFALPACLDAGEIISFAVTAKALCLLKTERAGFEVVSATAVGEAALKFKSFGSGS